MHVGDRVASSQSKRPDDRLVRACSRGLAATLALGGKFRLLALALGGKLRLLALALHGCSLAPCLRDALLGRERGPIARAWDGAR